MVKRFKERLPQSQPFFSQGFETCYTFFALSLSYFILDQYFCLQAAIIPDSVRTVKNLSSGNIHSYSRVKNVYCLFFSHNQTKAVGQPRHPPCKQAHNFPGMLKLTIQKHSYHPLAGNSWLTEQNLSLWQEARDCSITLVFRTTTCASLDRLKQPMGPSRDLALFLEFIAEKQLSHDQQLKRWKSVTRSAPQICPFLRIPLFFSYPPKAICFTCCFWCIKPHMFPPQLLLGPWMTHVLYYHWHFGALNVTCWKKARWPN